MRRREFIGGVGASAVLGARGAWGQRAPLPVVGVLHSIAYDKAAPSWSAFHDGMKQGGYLEGQNVALEYRSGLSPQQRALAASEFVERGVTVIFAAGSAPALAAKAATRSIPIVFTTGGDPVGLRLVTSLSRPEGNVTGTTRLSHGLAAKQYQILLELTPKAHKVAVLISRENPNTQVDLSDLRTAAQTTGQDLLILNAPNVQALDEALKNLRSQELDAVLVGNDPFYINQIDKIIAALTAAKLPAMFSAREPVEAGGLMSYGASRTDTYFQCGVYVAKILGGELPGRLPVQQASKIELVLNLKAAKEIGVTVPLTLLGRADEVIE